ncbi:MAG: hypothetical protein QOI21_3204 [Actinomycetota bacterium]|jgi:hypothetical protein|nr:hypothetical protein [Actinomycetota bacterium]
MKLKCQFNNGKDLPAQRHGLYYTERSVFHVSVGRTYEVYAMTLYKKGITVLVLDDVRQPNWYPVELFEVVGGDLPDDWKFARRGEGEHGTEAIFGYPELVDDESHLESLVGLKKRALEVFSVQVERRTGEKLEGFGNG